MRIIKQKEDRHLVKGKMDNEEVIVDKIKQNQI